LAQAAVINADVTAPSDQIYGIASSGTTSTVSTVGTAGATNNYPAAEPPSSAIDNNTTTTKYLNFQTSGAGFIVTLTNNGQSVLNGVHFTSGNDSPERDPVTVTIEGTNTAIPSGVAPGGTITATWSPIYSGVSGLTTDPGRNASAPTVAFVPATLGAFTSYRLTVNAVRTPAGANSFQFNEVELIGNTVPVPEPGSIGLLATGVIGLIARRRRA
jgi:hypothetical protein